ncbi:hypothetical protein CHUAL_001981 [Chamberlinius hualienensis]
MFKLLFAIVVSAAVLQCEGLHCRPCDPSKCFQENNNCTYGTVKDVCGCCNVCGKGDGERCGGPWNLGGKCGQGLKCAVSYEPSYGICKKE